MLEVKYICHKMYNRSIVWFFIKEHFLFLHMLFSHMHVCITYVHAIFCLQYTQISSLKMISSSLLSRRVPLCTNLLIVAREQP